MDPTKVVPIGTTPKVKDQATIPTVEPTVETAAEVRQLREGSILFANTYCYSTPHSLDELKTIIAAIKNNLYMF